MLYFMAGLALGVPLGIGLTIIVTMRAVARDRGRDKALMREASATLKEARDAIKR